MLEIGFISISQCNLRRGGGGPRGIWGDGVEGKPNGEGRVSQDVFFLRRGAVRVELWRRGRQGRYRRMKSRVGIYYNKGG